MKGNHSSKEGTYRYGGAEAPTSCPVTSPVSQLPQAPFTAGKTEMLRGEKTGSAFPTSSDQKFYNTDEVVLSRFLRDRREKKLGLNLNLVLTSLVTQSK